MKLVQVRGSWTTPSSFLLRCFSKPCRQSFSDKSCLFLCACVFAGGKRQVRGEWQRGRFIGGHLFGLGRIKEHTSLARAPRLRYFPCCVQVCKKLTVSSRLCGGSWANDRVLLSIFHFPVWPKLSTKFLDPDSLCPRKETPSWPVPCLTAEHRRIFQYKGCGLEFASMHSNPNNSGLQKDKSSICCLFLVFL